MADNHAHHPDAPTDRPGPARIPLNHGREALVDTEDLPRVAAHRWYAACEGDRARVRTIRMANFILGATCAPGGAHVNGGGLDNRRANLRLSTPREEGARRRLNRNNRSGYRGVSWHAQTGKWRAGIVRRPLKLHIGYYATAAEAARAYDARACELFGEHAYRNFPGQGAPPRDGGTAQNGEPPCSARR